MLDPINSINKFEDFLPVLKKKYHKSLFINPRKIRIPNLNILSIRKIK